MVPIQLTDDATIHFNETIKFVTDTGELKRRDYRAANQAVFRMYALTSSHSVE